MKPAARCPLVKVATSLLLVLAVCKLAVTTIRFFPENLSIIAHAPQAVGIPEVHAQETPRAAMAASAPAKPEPPNEPKQQNTEANFISPETWTAIREQKKILESKEMELKEREARLREMEREIENRLKELISVQEKIKQAQQEIQAFREEREQARNAQVQALAKIYGNMKPKEASQLLETLEEPLAVKVISLMSPDQVAKILASMETKKAAKLSRALTGR